MKSLLLLTSLCLLLGSTGSWGYEQGSLKRCQAINHKILFYTAKRRQGGSSSAMLKWRKQRNHYNTLYFQNNCKAHSLTWK